MKLFLLSVLITLAIKFHHLALFLVIVLARSYIFELGFGSFTGSRDFQSLWYYGRRINDHLVRHVVMRVIELISILYHLGQNPPFDFGSVVQK